MFYTRKNNLTNSVSYSQHSILTLILNLFSIKLRNSNFLSYSNLFHQFGKVKLNFSIYAHLLTNYGFMKRIILFTTHVYKDYHILSSFQNIVIRSSQILKPVKLMQHTSNF